MGLKKIVGRVLAAGAGGTASPDQRGGAPHVGAVLADGERVLAWIPRGAAGDGWALPSFPVRRGRRRDALLRGLKEELGIEARLVRRVVRRRALEDATDWWLVDCKESRPVIRPQPGVERWSWMERAELERFGCPRFGQSELLADYQRLVVDSYRPPLEERRLVVDGVELAYSEFGEGPPLVLLHGLGANLQDYRWTAPEWARNFRVIAIDFPGFGHAEKPDGLRVSITFMAHTLRRILDLFGIERTHVVGHSMGGLVSMAFAASYPERVERVVLLSPSAFQAEHRRVVPASFFAAMYRSEAFHLIRGALFVERFRARYARYSAEMDVLFGEQRDKVTREDFPNAARAVADGIESITSYPTRKILSQIKAPLLVLFGELDQIVPCDEAYELGRALPQAQVRILPGVGHLPMIEAQAEVIRRVRDFLRDGARVLQGNE